MRGVKPQQRRRWLQAHRIVAGNPDALRANARRVRHLDERALLERDARAWEIEDELENWAEERQRLPALLAEWAAAQRTLLRSRRVMRAHGEALRKGSASERLISALLLREADKWDEEARG